METQQHLVRRGPPCLVIKLKSHFNTNKYTFIILIHGALLQYFGAICSQRNGNMRDT